MFSYTLFAIVGISSSVVASHGEEQPKYKPVSAETVAAFKKLSAEYGVSYIYLGDVGFLPGDNDKGLPGFIFRSLKDGALPKLPAVDIPFAIHFNETRVTDAGLKELKDSENLIILTLRRSKVTDAGMKELSNLKKL